MNRDAIYMQPSDHWLEDSALFQGVRGRRVAAFLIDLVIVTIAVVVGAVIVGILGILTLGLGWLLYAILGPLVALGYVAATLGGPGSATVGMRLMGLQMRRLDGDRMDPALAVIHAVFFYASVSILTPLVLLVGLFANGKRLLHDILLGVVVVNADAARGPRF